jgi:hypothetical protein
MKKKIMNDEFSSKMMEQLWIDIKGYPIPENLSDVERSEIWNIHKRNKNLEFDFKFYKKFDVSDLKSEMLNIDDTFWKMDRTRQKKYTLHKDTECLSNTFFPLFYDDTLPIVVYKKNFLPKSIQKKTDEIITELENEFNGKVLNSNYVKLFSGGIIPRHIDDIKYFQRVKRFQICIDSNPQVYFNIGQTQIVFEEGDCYQINNTKFHSVHNKGQTDRINLIVDIMPWEYIGESYTIQ